LLIGAHESIAGGVSQAFARAQGHGGGCFQIFTKNARGWAAEPLQDAERKRYRSHARTSGLPSMAHGSYLVNLATEDAALWDKSTACLLDEFTRAERLGLKFLVIHPGSHPDAARGIRQIARALDEVLSACRGFKARICLEVTAGQGNSIGWRFEQLADILSATQGEQRLSVCLDTCHLFAAGYDLRTQKGYEKVMAEFDHRVGLDRVGCFHLNDCKGALGCRVDRHECLGEGSLGWTPFRCLIKDVRFKDALGVLETPFPERYAQTIKLLNSFARG